jgi:zinc transport system permease protein
MPEILTFGFMQLALLAAFFVGLAAPMVGVFLVQRRLSLIGDGMGHVALAGVAVGVVTNQAPVLTALIFAVLAAVGVELVRARGRTSADVALAVMFYGGIALGVVVINSPAGSTPTSLDSYLFGAISLTTEADVKVFAALALVVVAVTWALRPRLFAVANDEEYARATGMRVTALNITLAVLTAVTVVVAMRVVGLLLISALMIVPNATAQLVARSFRSAIRTAVVIVLLRRHRHRRNHRPAGDRALPRGCVIQRLARPARQATTSRGRAARARARRELRSPGAGAQRPRRLPP